MTVKTIQFDQLQETVYHEKWKADLTSMCCQSKGLTKPMRPLQQNMALSITNLCRLERRHDSSA